jgi:hypothetical protein
MALQEQLNEMAKKLVAEYERYIRRPESPFAPKERTPFHQLVDELERMGLATFYPYQHKGSRIFRVVIRVTGSPAIYADGVLKFLNKEFAIAVCDELINQGNRDLMVVEEIYYGENL